MRTVRSCTRAGAFCHQVAKAAGAARAIGSLVETNFANVDFPTDTLSPPSRTLTSSSFNGTWTFAVREIGIAQLLYLVLFSYSFFWDGFTGLAITIGAIATLFFVMQTTGPSDWRGQARRLLVSEAARAAS